MSTRYRFGRVEVRPAERQVLVEGQPATVGARAFDVLMALIDRRDRVVSKDELLSIVWPGLVVEENNLQVQVSTLRKHLGSRAVATIPGRGYRFTLEHESAEAPLVEMNPPRHNLPAQLNRFIGREREIAEVKDLLASSRLVTLVSLGGTGKTRLSLQVAHEVVQRFPGGVWFVELAPVADEARVAQAIAAVLGVQEQAGSSLAEAIVRWASTRNLLLVIDNCEHLLRPTAELVKQVLQAAPSLHVLASSREPLRLGGETVFPLSPLPVPDPRHATSAAVLGQYESVQLFVDRAAAANNNFRLSDTNVGPIATICRRLDGIPLAIELAAARVRAMSVETMAARLDDRFRLLKGGDQTAAPRQQTLRASLDWSYDLLTAPEAALLRRLAVFSGGWTLDAAESVAAGGDVDAAEVLDLLTRLVEKCFVETDPYGERYRLLETVRQYALEKLEGFGEVHALRERHLSYYLDLVTVARPRLVGSDEATWLKRLDEELENILAAHGSADGERSLRLVSCIKHYCLNRGLIGLAHRLATEAVARAPARSLARSLALLDAGQVGFGLGRYAESRRYLEESIAIAEELGDTNAVAVALQPLGYACMNLDDLPAARRHLQAGLEMARQGNNQREIATALTAMASLHRISGDLETAANLYREVVDRGRHLRDRELTALSLLNLAMAAVDASSAERSSMVIEALDLGSEVGSHHVGQSALDACAGLMGVSGAWDFCARMYGAARAQFSRTRIARDKADEAFLSPLVGNARAALGEEFDRLEAEGQALSYDAAIAEARACLGGSTSRR